MPYIREIISLYDSEEKEKLYTWISRNREQIREFFNKTTNGGCSRIREWNEFIKHYSLLYVEMENICHLKMKIKIGILRQNGFRGGGFNPFIR